MSVFSSVYTDLLNLFTKCIILYKQFNQLIIAKLEEAKNIPNDLSVIEIVN